MATPTERNRETGSSDRAAADAPTMFAIWAFLLAAGTVLHEALASDWHILTTSTPLMLISLAVLTRPADVRLFLLFSIVYVIDTVADMPYIVNHTMAHGIFAVTIVVAWLSLAREGRASDAGALYARSLPPIRVMVLLMYFFAGLAKANRDFLVPELSSAVFLLERVHDALPFVPVGEWTSLPVIWGTLLFEFTLPVLLAVPATRVPSVFLALGFHVMMSISGHPAFSALAPALLFAFLPDDLPQRLRGVRERRPGLAHRFEALRSALARPAVLPLLWAGWLALIGAYALGWITPELRSILLYNHFVGLKNIILPYYALLAVTLALCVVEGPVRYRASLFAMRPALVVFPLLMVFNGLCPYLGLKTQSSFTMFSNLQTEEDQWNHLFMPRWLRVFSYQDELVHIVASDDELLQKSIAKDKAWVPFELHRYLSEHPEASVTYERGGVRRVVARAGDDALFSKPPPLVLRKALWFRTVAPPEQNGHRH